MSLSGSTKNGKSHLSSPNAWQKRVTQCRCCRRDRNVSLYLIRSNQTHCCQQVNSIFLLEKRELMDSLDL